MLEMMTTVKPYLCGACDESFSRYKELSEHKQLCAGESSNYAVQKKDNGHFSCVECNEKFLSYNDLMKHKKMCEILKSRDSVTCSDGNLKNTIYSLIHNNIITKNVNERNENKYLPETKPKTGSDGAHKATKHNCNHCNIDFLHVHDLEKHQSTCNKQAPKDETKKHDICAHRQKFPRRCAEYGYQFRDGILYDPWEMEALFHVRPKKKQSEKKRYECSDCGKCYRRKDTMEVHMQSHTERKSSETENNCETEEQYPKETQPFPKMRMKQDKINLVCEQCEKVFKTKATLRLHMRTHTGLKPFQCTECGKCFSRKGNLQTHMRCHTGEKPCKCEECGKTFRHISGLRYHLGTHNRVKPYPSDVAGKVPPECTVCGKFFKHESGLKYHMKTHSNEKPFECNICGKLFKGATGLKYHTENHPSIVKNLICDECGDGFSQMKDLNIHKRIHSGKAVHICEVCNKHFLHSYNLKVHMGVHSDERPYQCEQCGKYFKRSEGLKNHIRTHMDMETLKRNTTELISMAETHLGL